MQTQLILHAEAVQANMKTQSGVSNINSDINNILKGCDHDILLTLSNELQLAMKEQEAAVKQVLKQPRLNTVELFQLEDTVVVKRQISNLAIIIEKQGAEEEATRDSMLLQLVAEYLTEEELVASKLANQGAIELLVLYVLLFSLTHAHLTHPMYYIY